MSATLLVSPLPDSEEISFSSITLHHTPCVDRPMSKHRNVVSGDYRLSCQCGLEIVLSASSGATERIVRRALGAEDIQLEPGTYSCVTEVVLAAA